MGIYKSAWLIELNPLSCMTQEDNYPKSIFFMQKLKMQICSIKLKIKPRSMLSQVINKAYA